ncbi:MAG: DUF305 domain-containing protein, partial [Terriglobus sp.]
MAFRRSCTCVFALSVCAGIAAAQQVPLVQPGAPGKPNTVITNPVGTAVHDPTAADFGFMQGMVVHHSQAVEMVGLMNGRTTNPQMLELGKRISISQGDEIAFMKRWLSFFGKPVTEDDMADMDTAVMPGMLTPRQMLALRNARGAEFDRLFLTGMIQHHTGALDMVKDLYDTKDAGREPQLFDFTADVDVTQRAEIETMKSMLAK